jgi:hypothetical protein
MNKVPHKKEDNVSRSVHSVRKYLIDYHYFRYAAFHLTVAATKLQTHTRSVYIFICLHDQQFCVIVKKLK